ncbi:MAG: YCF48-related protein [Candidatus Acidiferrum sp.]
MKRFCLSLLMVTAGVSWSVRTTGIDTNLRGISIASKKQGIQSTTIWASGSHGVVLRSMDAGKNWERLVVPQSESLDFRGIQAFNENEAYIMSSGEGEQSRIYKTTDGGKNWEMQYTDKRKGFFLDGLVCLNATNCYALSDPVNGKFLILRTEDGKTWKELSGDKMPDALPREGAFAASNTSLLLAPPKEIYFATGGPAARVFHSFDSGKSWTVVETPVIAGKAPQGIFSLAKLGDIIVAVGGDYEQPSSGERSSTYSLDHGQTWLHPGSFPGGYRSAVVKSQKEFIAVGPTGADISRDGVTWRPIEGPGLNALAFDDDRGWAVGTMGTIVECVKKNP